MPKQNYSPSQKNEILKKTLRKAQENLEQSERTEEASETETLFDNNPKV